MISSKNLIEYIKEYERYVKKGNEILQSYFKVNKSPLLAKREGKIPTHGTIESEKMVFYFHGIGCRLEFGEIVVDFDYSFGDFDYKGFEVSKLYMFVVSRANSDKKIARESFDQLLKELEKEGAIIGRGDFSYDTYDYILNK